MKNISILKTTQVSWQEYRDLRLKALKEEPQTFASSYESQKDDPGTEWQQRLKRYQEGDGNWMVFASNGEKLIGMMGAFQNEEDKRANTANIIAVYVSNEERGKGVSKLLMQSLLDELSKNTSIAKLKLSVNINQTAAVKLYENFGFKVVGKERAVLGDGKNYEEYLMEKMIKESGN